MASINFIPYDMSPARRTFILRGMYIVQLVNHMNHMISRGQSLRKEA